MTTAKSSTDAPEGTPSTSTAPRRTAMDGADVAVVREVEGANRQASTSARLATPCPAQRRRRAVYPTSSIFCQPFGRHLSKPLHIKQPGGRSHAPMQHQQLHATPGGRGAGGAVTGSAQMERPVASQLLPPPRLSAARKASLCRCHTAASIVKVSA